MLSPHSSTALEYWFFKVNCGPVALIVDWIERRRSQEHLMRVSIHSPGRREVIWETLAAPMPNDNFMNAQRTAGHAGEVAWDLAIDTGGDWIKPDIFPIALLRMSDSTLLSAPLARFSGWIRVGSQQTSLHNVPGLVSQYWGRQLTLEWWWISASQFDREGIAVESMLFRSSLWGSPAQIQAGFLYLNRPRKRELVMAPFNMARVSGTPEHFQLEIKRIGREKITLVGTGREYGDFGDRIINTITGDLEIHEGNRLIARAVGTAGLERRFPENASA